MQLDLRTQTPIMIATIRASMEEPLSPFVCHSSRRSFPLGPFWGWTLHAADHKSVSHLLMLVVFALSLAHRRAAPDVQGALRLPGCSLLLVSKLFTTLNTMVTRPYRRTTSNSGRLGTSGRVSAPSTCNATDSPFGVTAHKLSTHVRTGRPSEPRGENAFFESLAAAM